MNKLISFGFALLLGLGLTSQAHAHGRVVSSVPVAESAGQSPQAIMLRFNEKLEEKFCGFDLADDKGSKIAVTPAVSGGGLILTAPLDSPLGPGTYTVNWHVVTVGDGHRTQGTFSFTIN
jgi:hypothetical protein